MDGQLIAAGVIVCGAVFYLARQTWRTWAGRSSGCSKGCACGDKKTQPAGKLIPAEELTLRMRSEK
jgi:hypothetical protein